MDIPLTLTREEKLALIDALEERKRRVRERKQGYTPHADQLKLHRCAKRERWALCANSFGKTAALCQEVYAAASGHNPWLDTKTKVPARIVVVLDSPEKVKDQYLYEYKKWFVLDEDKQCHKDGKPYIRRISYPNGSEVLFLFHDMDPNKFEGISDIDYIFSDEPMPKFIYVALYRSLRGKGTEPRLLMCGTAISQSWIRTEVWQPWSRGELPAVECFKFTAENNRSNLRDGFLEEFAAKLTEAERRVRMDGGFFDAEGLALMHLWDRKIHIVKDFQVPDDWPCVLVIDPHPKKAHVALLVTVSPEAELFAVKEMASRAIPSEFAREVALFVQGYRIVDMVCDSLGSSELTGGSGNLSFIRVLNDTWRSMGFNRMRIRATTYDEKRDEAWISMIREVLAIPESADQLGQRLPQLRVFAGCKGLIFDIENAAWHRIRHSEEVKPKIDMTMRDYLSCLKYALAAQPKYLRNKQQDGYQWAKKSSWSGAAGSHRKEDKIYYDDDESF